MKNITRFLFKTKWMTVLSSLAFVTALNGQCQGPGPVTSQWFEITMSTGWPNFQQMAVNADGSKVALFKTVGASYPYPTYNLGALNGVNLPYSLLVLNTSNWSIDTKMSKGLNHLVYSNDKGRMVWSKNNTLFLQGRTGSSDPVTKYITATGTVYSSGFEATTVPANDIADDTAASDSIYFTDATHVYEFNAITRTRRIVYTNTQTSAWIMSGGAIAYDKSRGRIYFGINGVYAGTYSGKEKVECVNLDGTPCAGYTPYVYDVAGTGGNAAQQYTIRDLQVRPTDGKIFALRSTFSAKKIGGIAVFNLDGTPDDIYDYAWAQNIAGAMTNSNNISYHARIDFDEEGNLFVNVGNNDSGGYPIPLLKFFPSGKPDFAFWKNWQDSYSPTHNDEMYGFDIFPGGTIIRDTDGVESNSSYLNLTEDHIAQPLVFEPDPLKMSNYGWLGGQGNPAAQYYAVNLIYNNGKPKLPGESATYTSANCALATESGSGSSSGGGTGIVATGVLDCTKTTFMPAPVEASAQNLNILVSIDVATAGQFSPITISGSGLSLQDTSYKIVAATIGVQTFTIPVHYDGSALGNFSVTAGTLGGCTGSLASVPINNTKEAQIKIWTVDNCMYQLAAPQLK